MSQAPAFMPALVPALMPAHMPAHMPAQLRLRSMTWAAEGVLLLEWVDPAGAPLPAFEAGAHINLSLPNGLGRSYSLCNAPGETQRYCVAVGRDRNSRGGSCFVHEQLRPGALLAVSAPGNHCRLDESAPAFALLASVIGVTPVLAMARRLAALGKPVQMFYAVRSRAAAAFADHRGSPRHQHPGCAAGPAHRPPLQLQRGRLRQRRDPGDHG